MADKTYRMTVTLSNGSTVDAGTFVAPQGPQGPQGPSGALGEWQNLNANTELDDGLYIFTNTAFDGAGIGKVKNGQGKIIISQTTEKEFTTFTELDIAAKKYQKMLQTVMEVNTETFVVTSDTMEFSVDDLSRYPIKYILLKNSL